VSGFYKKQSDIGDKLKPIERRLKTLDEHIKQSEIIGEHRAIYKTYMTQKPKYKEGFCKAHRAEIVLYEAADRYLKKHLNGRTAIPLKEWRIKRGKLTAEKSALYGKYKTLKLKIREVETIRKAAEGINRAIVQPHKIRRKELDM
jgi:hypothetical protein